MPSRNYDLDDIRTILSICSDLLVDDMPDDYLEGFIALLLTEGLDNLIISEDYDE